MGETSAGLFFVAEIQGLGRQRHAVAGFSQPGLAAFVRGSPAGCSPNPSTKRNMDKLTQNEECRAVSPVFPSAGEKVGGQGPPPKPHVAAQRPETHHWTPGQRPLLSPWCAPLSWGVTSAVSEDSRTEIWDATGLDPGTTEPFEDGQSADVQLRAVLGSPRPSRTPICATTVVCVMFVGRRYWETVFCTPIPFNVVPAHLDTQLSKRPVYIHIALNTLHYGQLRRFSRAIFNVRDFCLKCHLQKQALREVKVAPQTEMAYKPVRGRTGLHRHSLSERCICGFSHCVLRRWP